MCQSDYVIQKHEIFNLINWGICHTASHAGRFENHIHIDTYNDEDQCTDESDIAAWFQSAAHDAQATVDPCCHQKEPAVKYTVAQYWVTGQFRCATLELCNYEIFTISGQLTADFSDENEI